MVRGVITSRHVFLHAPLIVSGFGMKAWLRCCIALVRREPTTFLRCVLRAYARSNPWPGPLSDRKPIDQVDGRDRGRAASATSTGRTDVRLVLKRPRSSRAATASRCSRARRLASLRPRNVRLTYLTQAEGHPRHTRDPRLVLRVEVFGWLPEKVEALK